MSRFIGGVKWCLNDPVDPVNPGSWAPGCSLPDACSQVLRSPPNSPRYTRSWWNLVNLPFECIKGMDMHCMTLECSALPMIFGYFWIVLECCWYSGYLGMLLNTLPVIPDSYGKSFISWWLTVWFTSNNMAIFQVANWEMTWGLPPRCQKIITGTALYGTSGAPTSHCGDAWCCCHWTRLKYAKIRWTFWKLLNFTFKINAVRPMRSRAACTARSALDASVQSHGRRVFVGLWNGQVGIEGDQPNDLYTMCENVRKFL